VGVLTFTSAYLFVENELLKYLALCLIVLSALVSVTVTHQPKEREAEGHTRNKGYLSVILLLYSAVLAMILLAGMVS
jgi:hypothetical protein